MVDGFGGVATEGFGGARVPEAHLGFDVVAHVGAGVSAEVLVGEEDDFDFFVFRDGLCAAFEGPFEDGVCVGAGADGAAVFADEGFDGGGGVHVGDGDDADGVVGLFDGVLELVPAVDGVFVVGHVSHGAAGGKVGEDDLDVVGGEDVGGFGHEVDTAENDVFGADFFDLLGGEL